MKNKKWILKECNKEQATYLSKAAGISKLAAAVLYARGLNSEKSVQDFFRSDLQCIHSPFLLDGIQKAVTEINIAIAVGDKIAVYGDYDVDGMTATGILMRYLRKAGANCIYYIPDRLTEGYGINNEALSKLKEQGVNLIITVDSGITAAKEVEFAKSLGIKMIITDHHECGNHIPDAVAVVNPLKQDVKNKYPFSDLAGVGVAFKLICALKGEDKLEEMLKEYSDLVAVGTIADVMSLSDENRVIVKYGIEAIENTQNIGLKMLMEQAGMCQKRITSTSISYNLAPKINAAGRMGCAKTAVELFLTDDVTEASNLAQSLCIQNKERQEKENEILNEISERLKVEFDPKKDKIIVMWGDGWHNGVIGIVASKLMEQYNVPAILVSVSGDVGKGSGRSIQGVNLYEAICENAEQLDRYGGHELAVGLTINKDKLPDFKQKISEYMAKKLEKIEIHPTLEIDCEISENDITLDEAYQLCKLEPFGTGNFQPVFCLCDVTVIQITPLKQDKHLKIALGKNGKTFSAILFNASLAECPVLEDERADIAFYIDINEFRGNKSVQLVLRDIKLTENIASVAVCDLELYNKFKNGQELTSKQASELLPIRQEFVNVFKHIKINSTNSMLNTEYQKLYRKIKNEYADKFTLSRMLICLDVFDEFRIFAVAKQEQNINIKIMDIEGKVELSTSRILSDIKRQMLN